MTPPLDPTTVQMLFTDCYLAKRLVIPAGPNSRGFVGLVHRDLTLDSPEVKAIERRVRRRKSLNRAAPVAAERTTP